MKSNVSILLERAVCAYSESRTGGRGAGTYPMAITGAVASKASRFVRIDGFSQCETTKLSRLRGFKSSRPDLILNSRDLA
jgi:hypothetical protein